MKGMLRPVAYITITETHRFARHSASPRNVVRNVRSLAPSSVRASSVSRSPPSPRSPSSPSASVLVAVSVPRNVPSVPFTSSTCPPTWRLRSPIVTLRTASSFTVFPCPVPVRSSVSSVPTVLERVRL
ncbi:hypothetical protein BO86DRAFT_99003 [Aspergillus japonicus CBS 114.51]|uniref:Uncharacterized protein n=1 Tax=Aspergillus japonicus CBS 114.51 TaxID=1448312 RepID=A0A8T8X1N2_ASPJA|nr:hypothetical protein BO86DRAFT_99003 [Aspergillus japonicus CBS 114.51]RAH81542.1 hypothetical protein BO86DRAFT_99003 [Aspergillus japonicus CBS 114.51]